MYTNGTDSDTEHIVVCRLREERAMGALDYISSFCSYTHTGKRKRKPLQTVEIKVKMDCDGCERRIRNIVRRMKGVKTVEVDRKQSRVTVNGHVDPNKVLTRVKSTGKKAEFWPYIPQHVVYYPFAPGMYDKRAPIGHIRNPGQAFPNANAPEENYVSLFSDDNVHGCSIV